TAPSGDELRSTAPSGTAPSGDWLRSTAPSGTAPSGTAPSGAPASAAPITVVLASHVKPGIGPSSAHQAATAAAPCVVPLMPTAPSGTAPNGTAPSGTAPSGTAPSGTAPSGTAPSGTAPSGDAAVDVAPTDGCENADDGMFAIPMLATPGIVVVVSATTLTVAGAVACPPTPTT